MTESLLDHPELIYGRNPLLEAAAPYVPFVNLPDALGHEPLQAIDWRSMTPERRVALLNPETEHYSACRLFFEISDSIQNMLRGGLMARNPLSVAEQRRINTLALSGSLEQARLQSLRVRASGGLCAAITGMGKSANLERTLKVIAPQQVVVHSKSEVCGWSSLTQVLYLIIDAPFNGTRGGLLARIVEGLDILLGTDYSATLRKLRNLDASLLFVTKLLSNHRVGMLAIDENQKDNLDESMWQRSFVLFFLGLMNLGIPVLLLGNPLAFRALEADSQVMRRFSTAGYYRLTPAATSSEDWWSKDYVPGMCEYSFCDEIPPIAEIVERTFEMSGGVPGLFRLIWIEAQRIALRRGGDRVCLTAEDLQAAAKSPRGKELVAIASQILGKTSLQRFIDIPLNAGGGVCDSGPSSPDSDNDPGCSPEGVKKPPDQAALVRAQIERSMKAKEKAAAKRKDKADHLSAEDLRIFELKMENFAGFEGIQEPLLSGIGRAPPKQR